MLKLSRLAVASLLLIPVFSASGSSPSLTTPVTPLSAWQHKIFLGETAYSEAILKGKRVVRAESRGTASGYYRKLSLNSADYPVISWDWMVNGTVAGENPYRREGDDYAARVYLIFPGRFFWQHRALVYVWSGKLPSGAMVPSPYSERVAIVALESGSRHVGEWRHETRNYVADYSEFFKQKPDNPIAVAFMTDTDNTGGEAVAWYGDISFSRSTTVPAR